MLLHSPAEYYIKFLVTHPDRYSISGILEIIADKGLDGIRAEYIQRLRSLYLPPEPFYPFDLKHEPSQRFLRREKIWGLYYPTRDEPAALAWRILCAPRAKEFVETMVISSAPEKLIAENVYKRFRIPVIESSIHKYKHYFWNLDLLDGTDLRTLLMLRAETGSDDADKVTALEARLRRKASYTDPRRVAADLPYSPVTALLAQMRMGALPDNLNLARVLEVARGATSLRFLEAVLHGGPEDSGKALNYITAAKISSEMLKELSSPEEELKKKLLELRLNKRSNTVQSIKQLSQGNYTTEIAPTKFVENQFAEDEEEEDVGGISTQ